MVPGVCTVKESPLLGIQRSEKWMIQQQRVPSETPLRILQSCIHGDEGIVEMPHRFDVNTILRTNLFESAPTGGHPTELGHHSFSHPVRPGRNSYEWLTTLQNPAQAFRCPRVGE